MPHLAESRLHGKNVVLFVLGCASKSEDLMMHGRVGRHQEATVEGCSERFGIPEVELDPGSHVLQRLDWPCALTYWMGLYNSLSRRVGMCWRWLTLFPCCFHKEDKEEALWTSVSDTAKAPRASLLLMGQVLSPQSPVSYTHLTLPTNREV